MARIEAFLPTHPGIFAKRGKVAGNLRVPNTDTRFARFPFGVVDKMAGFKTLLQVDDRTMPSLVSLTDSTGRTADDTIANHADLNTYATDAAAIEANVSDLAGKINEILAALKGETYTLDGAGTISRQAGGIRFQTATPANDNDDITITGQRTHAVVTGKWIVGYARVTLSNASNLGFNFGVGTSTSVEYYTAPADGVFFTKLENATAIKGAVIENTNAADETGTLATASTTAIDLSFAFKPDTANPDGYWAWAIDGTWDVEPFTAAQLAALDALVTTTAPTIAGHLGFRVNSTTQRNALVEQAWIGVER